MRARLEAFVLLLVGLPACTNGSTTREQSEVQELLPALGGGEDDDGGGDDPGSEEGDAFLRKSYGSTSMRRHECIQLNPDGTLVGSNCPSACVLWGPYLTAPSKSDAHLTFEISAGSKLSFVTDVVSGAGKHYHGATDDRELVPGDELRVGYRIHFFQPTDTVEGRFWVRGEEPVSFTLTDFKLEIQ